MAADLISDNCCLICSESFEWKPIPLRSKVNKDHSNISDEDDPSGGGAGKIDIRSDFKTALLLFCKLLKANRNGFGGDDDDDDGEEEWFRSLGNIYETTFGGGGIFEPPCCSGCFDALVEILRLQKVIKESLASQRGHLEHLKSSLAIQPSVDSKEDDEGSCQVWRVRNRLISRIENKQHLDALESKSKSKPETGRNSSTANNSKSSAVKMKQIFRRRKRAEDASHAFSLSNQVKSEEEDGEQEAPLRLFEPEFETPSPNPPESIDGGDSRRRSKRNRNSGTEDDLNELQILAKDFGLLESENESGSEGEDDDGEYEPPERVTINENIPTSSSSDEPERDESDSDDDSDSDYSIPKRRERKGIVVRSSESRAKNVVKRPITTAAHKKRRKRKSRIIPKSLGCPLFLSIGGDRLLYKSTLIKVSDGSGFTCEEEGCRAFVPGSDFDAFHKLRSHISSSHETEEYYCKLSPCPLCSKLLRLSSMRRHMISSHPSIPAICEVCWKPLRLGGNDATSPHIWLHKSAEDKRNVVASGGRNYDLQISKQREYQKSQAFPCDECEKSFSSNANLKFHKVSHVPKELRRKFECSQCDKKLLSERALQYHIGRVHNSHLDSRAWVCRICGKRYDFQSGGSFRAHMKSHEGNVEAKRNYVCDTCGKGCPSKSALAKHLNTHSSERQFQCEFCHMAYRHNSNLQRHQASAHKDKVLPIDAQFSQNFRKPEYMPGFIGPKLMYPCEVCGKAFPLRSRMTKHVKTAHHHEMV